MRSITCDPGGMTPKRTPAQQAEATLRALQTERVKLHQMEADLAARELAAVALARDAAVPWRKIAGWIGRSASNVCAQYRPHLAVTVSVADPADEEQPRAKPARR